MLFWGNIVLTSLALSTLGRHEEAAQALEQAAHLQPMNGHAWYELGMAYHTLDSRDKLAEVIAHLNRFDPKLTQHLVRATAKPAGRQGPGLCARGGVAAG